MHTAWSVKQVAIQLQGQIINIQLKTQLNNTNITQQLKIKLLVKIQILIGVLQNAAMGERKHLLDTGKSLLLVYLIF